MSLNVHHLELFYFVAKHEGITEAARKMPYGIQQPAVSGQILQLEKSLGVRLFQRRPFALTPPGEELYAFVEPFFSRLDQMASRLRGEEGQHLRVAASSTVMAWHLPEVLGRLRREQPGLRLTLRESSASDLEASLRKQEADLAVALLPRRLAPGIRAVKLLELPLVLLAPPGAKEERFADLVRGSGQIEWPLVSVPGREAIPERFQAGLERRGIRWDASVEVSDLSLVSGYVARGFGWGLAVAVPGVPLPDGIRQVALPQADFPPLAVGLLHSGELKPMAARFAEIAIAYAQTLAATGETRGDRAKRDRPKEGRFPTARD